MQSLVQACILSVAAATADTSIDVSQEGSIRRPYFRRDTFSNSTVSAFEQVRQYKEWRKKEEPVRKERMFDRRERAKEFLKRVPQPSQDDLEYVNLEAFREMTQKQKDRGLSWFGGGGTMDTDAYSAGVLVDPSQEYDMWAQGYRMLGGFIDCDHAKSDDDHNSGGSGDNGNAGGACSRWMMWAAVSHSHSR